MHDETLFVVPPGDITPAGKDHMAVFTPYYRRWEQHPAPRRSRRHRAVAADAAGCARAAAGRRHLCAGYAVAGPRRRRRDRRRAAGCRAWLSRRARRLRRTDHDARRRRRHLRLSPYLHFGCLSPLEAGAPGRRSGAAPAAAAFVRQLAWRDFHAQVLAARPDATRRDYRPRGDRWHRSAEELAAWREGRTGYPIVDAGMRQLAREGWMHNRARLITAHFLCKTLYIDWRRGRRALPRPAASTATSPTTR